MFDSAAIGLSLFFRRLLRKDFRLHRLPVGVHVVGHVIRMKRSEFRSVVAIQAAEEIKISEWLQGHTLPAPLRPVPLDRKLLGDSGHCACAQSQAEELSSQLRFK